MYHQEAGVIRSYAPLAFFPVWKAEENFGCLFMCLRGQKVRNCIFKVLSLLPAGGGGVFKEICDTVRLPVWRHVSRHWLSKWRAKCSSKRRIKISILSRKYYSDFLDLEILRFLYCHRKLDLSTFLEWNVQWCNEFKNSFLSSNKFNGQSYRP